MAIHSEQQSNRPSQQPIQAQAQQGAAKKPTSTRGFAAMDAEKHRKVSAEGGRASQQQQHNARQAQQNQSQSNVTGNFSQQNKQESSTESATSQRTGNNQSTGLNKTNPDSSHIKKPNDFDKDL